MASERRKAVKRWLRGSAVFTLIVFVHSGVVPLAAYWLATQQSQVIEKGVKNQNLVWAPPNVDTPIPSLSQIPACDLSSVLEQAGTSASLLATNLERFSALERIEYKMFDNKTVPKESDDGTFDYVFAFEQENGGSTSREYRTPTKGGHGFRASGQDTGQVTLALIFHPNMQTDYQMKCEGLEKRNGQLAWVVQFHQRKDKPGRTLRFPVSSGSYSAALKGRAWISAQDFHVIRLETTLIGDIPAIKLQSTAISIDYTLVFNQSQKTGLWLPGRIEAYWEYTDRRVILVHTYANFKLFVVETEEKIKIPKER
jgi:hypothetical protein